MTTLAQRLREPIPPAAKVVHLAFIALGEGTYTPAQVAEALGLPPKGRYLTDVISGAKWLRVNGYVKAATGRAFVTGPAYAKPSRKRVAS